MPPSVWNLRSNLTYPFEKRRLQQISAYNVSTVRDSKISIMTNKKSPRAFQQATDGVRTLPLSPPVDGSKSDILFLK